ncbi:pyocin activator PrtN family protein [Leptospira sp. 96542]|jgi:hypothetical protein|nr:pyocin activator PrtN family protein [Leptospira sp. 96542]
MNTTFLLMAQYNARAIIPVATVVKDYFPHLSVEKFLRKVSVGEIKIPLTRIDGNSQKGARGVHLQDLADYIDARRSEALRVIQP